MSRWRGGALVGALALAAALGIERAPSDKSLLLIVSDTLRADELACYGGNARTPHICSLAERGVLFEHAYSNASWTLPASVALFTGNHPSEYAHDDESGDAPPGADRFFYVDDGETLLAEALAARGYATASFVENPVAERPNVLQGFERLEIDDDAPRLAAVAERVGVDTGDPRWARLLPALGFLLREDRSFFALQWINDPHAVYSPPPRFLDGLDAHALPRPLEYYTGLGSHDRPEAGARSLKKVGKRLSPAEVALVRELYRREVESVDERVGHLLRALELSGRTAETFVVFTSDHGEGFGEHGRFLHGNSFYDELVAVPLLIAGPGIAGGLRVPDAVSLVDVMPTLRELLDVECLRPDVRGQSLAPLLAGVRDAARRPSYLVNHSLSHRGDALVEGRHKLIAGPTRPLELYNLERDPGERRDLAARRPEVAARMARQLRALRRENEARRERRRALADAETLKQTREETVEQLRALGYVE